MYFPLFVGILCVSFFRYALHCVRSSFAIVLKRKRKLVALTDRQTDKHYKCSVALPRGAVGWYAVCYCGYMLILLTYFLV